MSRAYNTHIRGDEKLIFKCANQINYIIMRLNIILFILILAGGSLFSQILEPVKWTISKEKVNEDEWDLIFRADIDKRWNVYGLEVEDGGPVPTSVWYEENDQISLIGDPVESGSRKEGMDPVFQMNVVKFLADKPYILIQRVKVLDKGQPLSGYLTYMTCDDEQCLPPTDVEFSFDFSTEQTTSGAALSTVMNNNDGREAINQRRESIVSSYENPISDCGITIVKNTSLPWMFLFGFLGGLLALLTPCVFPMLPLTVSFFTKDTKRKGWVNGMIYGLSIIVIYVALGLLISLIFGPEALNRLSTNWIANTFFFLIFIVFAFSFFGFYEITLPSSWSTKSDSMADKGGLIGIFFMAFTLALVSFSCTGPIIGTAIVQAASNQIGPFIVMLGFSLALAIPFGLFAAFPAWLNTLPKSGGWMNSVKVSLGFIELALAFKFLSVADMTNHWGILRYEVFMIIWVLIAVGVALYGFGLLKFPHDTPIKKFSVRRWVYSLSAVALVIYLCTGFIYKPEHNSYNSLKLLSGIAPPANYNFFLPDPVLPEGLKSQYPSLSKCANNIDCFKDYEEGLAYARSQGKPIMIDHTGYGCVNCRKTEEHIWVDERIRKILNEDFVLVSLYVDDDQELEKPLYSEVRQKLLRNIGNLWADFQIVNFAQNSQPLYVMVTPDEKVITHPRGYKEGVEGYLRFLECGLSTFRALSAN